MTQTLRPFAPHVPQATTKRRVTLKITLAPRMRADPRTTLPYIRTRDRLSQSPTYVLKN
ncbi:hypothetical protein [Singulisphaera acidiphila]|uniref:hypothetical protein n=1 Tax=Singulisphaera acidiphila TaxID=466153 RepID=UPI0002ED16F5|nr:hypothetical protein [Singulisphaera acidiphila]